MDYYLGVSAVEYGISCMILMCHDLNNSTDLETGPRKSVFAIQTDGAANILSASGKGKVT